MTSDRLPQLRKMLYSYVATEAGISMVRSPQPLKQAFFNVVRFAGRIMLCREPYPLKALDGTALAGFAPLATMLTPEMSRRVSFMRSRMKLKSLTSIEPKRVRSLMVPASVSLMSSWSFPAVTQRLRFDTTSAAFWTIMLISCSEFIFAML